jgi:phosphoglycolate phosphatase-like HAD superfamily hydrolase
MKNRIFVLDLDGVVINSIQHGIPMLEKMAIESGLSTDEDFIDFVRSLWGKHMETEFAPALSTKYGWKPENSQKLISDFLIIDHRNPAPLVPGSRKAIGNLQKRGSLMVITNRGQSGVSAIMRPDMLKPEWFTYVQHTDSGLPKKPHPQAMEKIIAGADGQPIYYVGDSVHDDLAMVTEAQKLYQREINFLGVLSGVSTKKDFLAAGLKQEMIFKDLLVMSQAMS